MTPNNLPTGRIKANGSFRRGEKRTFLNPPMYRFCSPGKGQEEVRLVERGVKNSAVSLSEI